MTQHQHEDDLQAVVANMEAMHKLMRARFMQEMRSEHNLHSHSFVLYVVAKHQPINSRKLGQLLFITPGAVTQAIDALVKDGLVQRHAHSTDRRIIELTLTPTGRVQFAKMQQARQRIFKELFSALSDQEIHTYLTVQQKLLSKLQELQKKGKE